MLFNSLEFAVFLPVVFILYWFVLNRNLKVQNGLILVASYFFYGWWDWRFLSLIAFSSTIDYLVGLGIQGTDNRLRRRLLLMLSILVNLGFLGFFKYFNFFADSFAQAFTLLGSHMEVSRLKIILPVGISFYTFQTLSYSIDIYRGKLKPTRDVLAFFSYVSFFPQLVAGPIERAGNLLPQFIKRRDFDYKKAVDGSRQILWGLFKKMVIADNCAYYVNDIFANYGNYNSSTLVLGAILFTIQVYGDFSGYSDIAIGTARLFGFNLMQNFAFPFFSRDIAEFWRRWHISLSTWFRDYVYIPLGGSRVGTTKRIRNIFIMFIISGFWHGANWNFIVWGALNAIYFLPLMLLNRNRKWLNTVAEDKWYPNLKEVWQMLATFALFAFSLIFFRSASLSDAIYYVRDIATLSLFEPPQVKDLRLFVLTLLFFAIEWFGRRDQYALEMIGKGWKRPFRWAIYYAIVIIILSFTGSQQDFVYFQF